jgi:energy-coupling factor transporter transmembrane protein EcfT
MQSRKRLIVLFVLMSLVFVPRPVYAYPGAGVINGVAGGTVWIVKGTYSVVKYFVVEVFRPVRAVTKGLVHLFGVPVKE